MSNQPSMWDPSTVATVVYRAVMIVVSLAFIWRKYRRSARRVDEEQPGGTPQPIHSNPGRRGRASNSIPQRQQHEHAFRFSQDRGAQIEAIADLTSELDDLGSDTHVDDPGVDSSNDYSPAVDPGTASTT